MREALEVASAIQCCPASPGRGKTDMDLHVSTVAVRDVILELRCHFRAVDAERVEQCRQRFAFTPAEWPYALQAMQLATALEDFTAGSPPPAQRVGSYIRLESAGDLDDETRELLRVARWWGCIAAYQSSAKGAEDRTAAGA